MSKLNYELDGSLNDSYLKNYKAIQFIKYFRNKEIEQSIIKSYSYHFDIRIREDLEDNLGFHKNEI